MQVVGDVEKDDYDKANELANALSKVMYGIDSGICIVALGMLIGHEINDKKSLKMFLKSVEGVAKVILEEKLKEP